MGNCRFCYPLNRRNNSLVLTESKNFYVMASAGPIIEGYVLICSKKHISSCANIPNEVYSEYSELKELIKNLFFKKYGGYTFFEHGKTKLCAQNGSDNHCFHAHLHALPTKADILPKLIKELGQPIEVSNKEEVLKATENNPYLYYETYKGCFVWKATGDLRQQFFRWILAEELGALDKADWKENPNWDVAIETVKKLKTNFVGL